MKRILKFLPDILLIGAISAAAAAVWLLDLPLWMLVICLAGLVLAVISLLGDLGLFGGADQDF